jgi:lipooligosaccharide transport system permease protein
MTTLATPARRAPADRCRPWLPIGRRLLGRSWYLLERNALVYRRTWLAIVSGFFEPCFFLLSVGFGVGRLVGDITLPDGTTVDYTAFVAPGLLAAAAMHGSLSEATFRLYRRVVDGGSYQGVLGTPVGVGAVTLAEVLWAVVRGAIYATGFLALAIALDIMRTWWVLVAFPAALLVCVAFAAAGVAWTATMRSWQDLQIVALLMLPLFLCSGTFVPVSAFPGWLQVVVWATPLFHGAELVRAASIGSFPPVVAVHLAYLVVMTVGCGALARRQLRRRFVH